MLIGSEFKEEIKWTQIFLLWQVGSHLLQLTYFPTPVILKAWSEPGASEAPKECARNADSQAPS